MGDWTMVLAKLAVVVGGRKVAGRAERVGQQLHRIDVRMVGATTQVIVLNLGQALLGQPVDCVGPDGCHQLTECGEREGVVGLTETLSAGWGQQVCLGRPAASARTSLFLERDLPGFQQRGQVAAHTSGGEVQFNSEFGRSQWPAGEQ